MKTTIEGHQNATLPKAKNPPEYSPFGNGPGHDGGGGRGERQLEQERGEDRAHLQALGADEPIADPEEGVGPRVLAVAEAVAKGPVGHSAQHDVHGVLHHDVHFVLQGDAAGLEHSET